MYVEDVYTDAWKHPETEQRSQTKNKIQPTLVGCLHALWRFHTTTRHRVLFWYFTMKVCRICKVAKDESEFYLRKKNNLSPDCKKCQCDHLTKYRRERKKNDPSYFAKVKQWNRKSRARPETKRIEMNTRLKKEFGITIEIYDAMYAQQGGVCAICGKTGAKRLSVDHNHVTNEIRGLLCFRCNMGIGYLKDDPEILARAIAYLKQSKSLQLTPLEQLHCVNLGQKHNVATTYPTTRPSEPNEDCR